MVSPKRHCRSWLRKRSSLNHHEHTVVTRSMQSTATTFQHIQIAEELHNPPSPKGFKRSIQDDHKLEKDDWTARKQSWGHHTDSDRRKCYNCSQEGHVSRNCAVLQKRTSEDGPTNYPAQQWSTSHKADRGPNELMKTGVELVFTCKFLYDGYCNTMNNCTFSHDIRGPITDE